MKAKIHSDVKPLARRTFDVVKRITYPNGRKTVLLDVGRNGSFGQRDTREYNENEVDLILEEEEGEQQ